VIPERELFESTSRSGGPGGQHVNKTSSRVTLRWSIRDSVVLTDAQRGMLLASLGSRLTRAGELIVHAEDSRSQSANRRLARQRLAALLQAALHRPARRVPTRPSRAAHRRRVDHKRHRAMKKKLRGRVRSDHE